MKNNATLSLGLVLILVGLGAMDALTIEKEATRLLLTASEQKDPQMEITEKPLDPLPPQGSVRKHSGPDVLELLIQHQFTFTDATEKTILQRIAPESEPVMAYAILKDGDRAGMIAWIDSTNVKRYYIVLKEALHAAFTPQVQDLVDETQKREGKPTRNFLTFLDPGLTAERVVFVRVRERLYEIHISEKAKDEVFELIEVLTD